MQAAQWFARLEQAIFSLEVLPLRGARVPEDAALRQLLPGRKPYVYRVIYEVDEAAATVLVLRHEPWNARISNVPSTTCKTRRANM